MDQGIAQIAGLFQAGADSSSAVPLGSGLINDTFLLRDGSGQPAFVLQRINRHVFPDVPGLMANMAKVTAHLKKADPQGTALTLVPLHDGRHYHQDPEGDYWRMFHYISGTRSYDRIQTGRQAFEGGRAFGHFQALLAGLPAKELTETIPGFLNCRKRLDDLEQAIHADRAGRVEGVRLQLRQIHRRSADMLFFQCCDLPQRVTHNDTKFNNVLLDQNDRACCVIDLDTVMPGFAAYDFGDAIRTIINTAAEDEPDTSLIGLNFEYFEAYARGYFQQARGFLTEAEAGSMIRGVFLLPYLQAVRFLTDHLDGDRYYKIQFPNHNLVRANAQLTLLFRLEESREKLVGMISRAWAAPNPITYEP